MLPTRTDIILPDGLELNPVSPDFLNGIWPLPLLDSSMGSLLLVGTIYVIAILASAGLFFVGRSFPRVRGFLFSGVFLITGLFAGFSGYVGIQNWNAENSVSEQSIAQINIQTYDWLQANGVKVSQRESLDLVCEYYEAKSSFCTGAQPMAKTGNSERKIKMNKGQDGFMALIDAEHQIPLIGEGSRL